MKLLINPSSKLFRQLRKSKLTYLQDVFFDTIENIQFQESKNLGYLEAIVPSCDTLGISVKMRRTAIKKLSSLGLWDISRTIKGEDGGTVIKLIQSEFIDIAWHLGKAPTASDRQVEINGVKFIAPEWLDVDSLRESLTEWTAHVKSIKHGLSSGVFSEDLPNLKLLFKQVTAKVHSSKRLHKIYYATKNNSILQNTIIKECIKRGYTTFNVAKNNCNNFFDDVKSSPKTDVVCNIETVVESEPISTPREEWRKVHLHLKAYHDIKRKIVDIKAEMMTLNSGEPFDFPKLLGIIESTPSTPLFNDLKNVYKKYNPSPKKANKPTPKPFVITSKAADKLNTNKDAVKDLLTAWSQ